MPIAVAWQLGVAGADRRSSSTASAPETRRVDAVSPEPGPAPGRTALTILGITIGIWALVVFGSMANKIKALVAGGSTYYADKITVARRERPARRLRQRADVADDGRQDPRGRRRGRRRLRRDDADGRSAERGHDGRAADDHRQRARRGPGPRDIQAQLRRRPGEDRRRRRSNVAVLGSDIARKYDKHVGDTIDPQGRAVHGHRRPRADPDGARPGGAACRSPRPRSSSSRRSRR